MGLNKWVSLLTMEHLSMATAIVTYPLATSHMLDLVVLASVFSHFGCLVDRLDSGKTHLCTMAREVRMED